MVVGKNSFCLYTLCLHRGLCRRSDIALLLMMWAGFFPLQTSVLLEVLPKLVVLLVTTSGGRRGCASLFSAPPGNVSWVCSNTSNGLAEVDQGALTQLLLLAGGAAAVSCRRQAAKSSRVGGKGRYF